MEVVAPVAGRENNEQLPLSDFQSNDQGEITACPQGQKATAIKRTKTGYRVHFDLETCRNCPLHGQCPVTIGRRKARLDYSDKERRLSERRREMRTDAFKNQYRFRSGIEGTNSQLARKTGLKKLRVRGLSAVSYRVKLKALALNIFRAAAVMAAKIRKLCPQNSQKRFFIALHLLFAWMITFVRTCFAARRPFAS